MFSFVRSRTLFTGTILICQLQHVRDLVLSGEQRRLNKCTWILKFKLLWDWEAALAIWLTDQAATLVSKDTIVISEELSYSYFTHVIRVYLLSSVIQKQKLSTDG